MTGFVERERREARGYMLRATANGSGESAGATMLQFVLDQVGIRHDLSWVETEMAWLETNGLASNSTFEGVRIAELSERGRDVLEKRVKVEGVILPRVQN